MATVSKGRSKKVTERKTTRSKSQSGKKKTVATLKKIIKRDGKKVPFDRKRIVTAVTKALKATDEYKEGMPEAIADGVISDLIKTHEGEKDYVPSVEELQDFVERQLILKKFTKTAKAYILYREKHAELRRERGDVPDHVKKLAQESKKYFRNEMAEFVYYRTYARWIEEENRRETWIETVDRYMNFMKENLPEKSLNEDEYNDVREAILKQEIMPSMRLLQFAGKAARATNVCAYNCSFITPTKLQDFGEVMYLSMCGTGVGFSVESHSAQQLPQIKKQTGVKRTTHVVHDSKEGWADAFVLGLKTWFEGEDIEFDYSMLRPSGARLNTMGGKSSGPDPLRQLMSFSREKVLKRQGRRLTNLDVHDIVCKVGEIVVAGGVRRSALISLSDLDDQDMRHAKDGQFYNTEPQRMLANNSAVYAEKPSSTEFLDEWIALIRGGAGERGIFNRGSLLGQMPERRKKVLEPDLDFTGTNPCGEIILKSKQFCNLSEVVARENDTEKTLLRKVRLATILGTYQSTLTKFPYLSRKWKDNCEAERLLGVSVTGQWDSKASRTPRILRKLKSEAIKTNKRYAKKMGVNPSNAITCVKPSGTVSQVVDSSSGMHPRHAPYYIRRIRISATDALFSMLKEQGVPYYPEVGQTYENATTYVLEFPVKAPKSDYYKDSMTAMDQLKHWKTVKQNYTEHNPSVTISVGDDEWLEVANWLYENWEQLGGLSFLPRSEHVYQLAPYEEITSKRFNELNKNFPKIDFSKIVLYEKVDETEVKKELACASGTCEIDIPSPAEQKMANSN